jgi:fimbrial chaperone protein
MRLFDISARPTILAALAAGAALISSPAAAGTFQVSPINITVPADRPVGSLTVKNGAAEPVSIRVYTYKWTQENGKDVYTETRDLIASPPIFTISAGGSQLIRVGMPKATSDGEAAYRVIVEEIPRAAAEGEGIRVALRLNLPFYKQPKAKSAPNVQWTALRSKDGTLELQGNNRGGLHDQINRIDIAGASGARKTIVDQPGVVLPGRTRLWKALADASVRSGTPLKLILVKPGGEQVAEAVVQDRP